MDKPLWMWVAFFAVVGVLLAFDLGVLHRKNKEIGVKESLLLSAFYISMGLLFSVWIYWQMGAQSAEEYITGFLVEKSLSLDNIFVISMVFTYFAIPRQYQHRVLFWGIIGAIVMRGIMIGAGAALVQNFHWVLYIFAAFLIYTGIKMLRPDSDGHVDIGEHKAMKLLRRIVPMTDKIHGNKFFIKENGKRLATPLFAALIMVELVDILFAVDSIPAIFAITLDPYIVFTSNLFAILGLRALFFALSAVLHRFAYLKYALSLVLIFIGSKIFINDFMGWTKFPSSISLGVTVSLLAGGIIVSLIKTRGEAKA